MSGKAPVCIGECRPKSADSPHGICARADRVQELLRDARLLAEQLHPDFYLDGKDPCYSERWALVHRVRFACEAAETLARKWRSFIA